jgi:hypothetical protein
MSQLSVSKKQASKKKKSSLVAERSLKAARDSLTMPQDEHLYLERIQKECLKEAVHVTKSEILRAGLLLVRDMPTTRLLKIIKRLTKLSPGRPRQSSDKK